MIVKTDCETYGSFNSTTKKPRQNAVVLPVLMLKRVKSNILRQTEAGGPVGGRGGRVEPHPAHVARHVHADTSHSRHTDAPKIFCWR